MLWALSKVTAFCLQEWCDWEMESMAEACQPSKPTMHEWKLKFCNRIKLSKQIVEHCQKENKNALIFSAHRLCYIQPVSSCTDIRKKSDIPRGKQSISMPTAASDHSVLSLGWIAWWLCSLFLSERPVFRDLATSSSPFSHHFTFVFFVGPLFAWKCTSHILKQSRYCAKKLWNETGRFS